MKMASDFLAEAKKTMEERGKTYDSNKIIGYDSEGAQSAERSMGKCIKAFNNITGKDLSESEGWLIMLILKQVRQFSKEEYHEDSALDSVAYASLLAESLSSSFMKKAKKDETD